jgi:hypothetical protein
MELRVALHLKEASSLISVSTQLEAIGNNGQCTADFVQYLLNMVTNLTKEVTELNNDNTLLQEEIKDLHSLIEVFLRPTSQYITRDLCYDHNLFAN